MYDFTIKKNLEKSDKQNIAVIIPKFEQDGFTTQ